MTFVHWECCYDGRINTRTAQKNMQHIKSNDTKIEVILRKALWARGYRYRKNYKELPGKPDIVLTKYKIAVFCDGEFSMEKIGKF